MLVWDDRSSVAIPGLSMLSKGMMNTHDEVTRSWFSTNAPRVKCQLVGRSGDTGQSFVEGQAAASFFSHHQVSLKHPHGTGFEEASELWACSHANLLWRRTSSPTQRLVCRRRSCVTLQQEMGQAPAT